MVRALSLRLQLLLLQALIVCVVTLGAGLVAVWIQESAIRDSYRERMVGVALSIARLPVIVEAFDDPDPSAAIQPVAEVIREASSLTYVVVTDVDGIRFSHPHPDRIGESVSTDPSIPLSGQVWSGTETGTLGESYRVKVPVYADGDTGEDDAGAEIIGSVSVGVLESELAADLQSRLPGLLLAFGGAAVAGVFGAAWVAALIRRRIFGLEPDEIAEMVGERETMLHRLSEGVIRVDHRGIVTSANDAAERIIDRGALRGRRADETLDGPLLQVMEDGEPEGRLVLAGERPVIARSTGLRDDRGRLVGATLLLRDHSELHEALRQMDGQQSLTEGLRAQAHEFANSLHVVSGLLELGAYDDAREFIARVRPGGSLDLGPDAAGLGSELTALLSVKLARSRELDVALEIIADGTPPAEAVGDIVTVVGNLVDNALEACRPGDRLRVTVDATAPAVRIVVDDSGAGVPDSLHDRVFDEGVSTKDARRRARGIGLALVRRVARRRGGEARVSRSPLGGARFEVVLPEPERVS
ncbi:ATP-binding protein [Microbacterium sp. NPDC089188]|uniref:ATP-binding protein n=1 Tax=Microbacterium sp. NPDC089188 TaxID=3154971 RepID=UPI003429A92C